MGSEMRSPNSSRARVNFNECQQRGVVQSTEGTYASANETARREVEERRVEEFCQVRQCVDFLDEMG